MSVMPQGQNGTGTREITALKSKEVIVFQIKVAFWMPIYIKTLVLFCWLFGTHPDPARVTQTITKGTKLKSPRTHKATGIRAILGRLLSPLAGMGAGLNLCSLFDGYRSLREIFIRNK
ncbi:hypothetical protein ACTM2X_002952 [Vibrio parahaemolyticus]